MRGVARSHHARRWHPEGRPAAGSHPATSGPLQPTCTGHPAGERGRLPAKSPTFCKPRTRHGAASVREGKKEGRWGALGLWGHTAVYHLGLTWVHHAGGSLGMGCRDRPWPAGTICSRDETRRTPPVSLRRAISAPAPYSALHDVFAHQMRPVSAPTPFSVREN